MKYLFRLFFSFYAAFALGQKVKFKATDFYDYREEFLIVDTLPLNADYCLKGRFQDFKPVFMVCSGTSIPAIVNGVWGSARSYNSVKYFTKSWKVIPFREMVSIYDLDENYAGWRPD